MDISIRNRLFFLVCICLPFLFVPKILQFTFIGGPVGTELIALPIVFLYAYTLYCWKKKFQFADLKKFMLFLLVYILFLLISLIHGLYIYPYYDLIFNGPANQIEKLPGVLAFLRSHGIMIGEGTLLDVWIVARFLKGIILEIIYTFGFSYLIYCWFKNDPEVAVRIVKKASFIIIGVIVIYSFFELFYFFGYGWAKSVLVNVNPLLHAIKENFGWWPPLLWDSPRVRSIFPEPSQFGMYAAFVMPFIWSDILNDKKMIVKIGMTGIMSLLMFLSLSKTSIMLLLLEAVLLLVFVVARRKIVFVKRCVMILVIMGISFGVNLACLSYYGSRPFDKVTNVFNINTDVNDTGVISHDKEIAKQYIRNNVAGVVNKNAGSNDARFTIIKSDLRIGMDHVFLGVGNGLKGAYTDEYLTNEEHAVPEVKMWGDLQHKDGIMKNSYPSINEFSKRFVENGLLGLFLYIAPLIVLCFILWKHRITYFIDSSEMNTLVCMFISLLGSFIAGGSGVLTTIQTYWILLGIAYAYALKTNVMDDHNNI